MINHQEVYQYLSYATMFMIIYTFWKISGELIFLILNWPLSRKGFLYFTFVCKQPHSYHRVAPNFSWYFHKLLLEVHNSTFNIKICKLKVVFSVQLSQLKRQEQNGVMLLCVHQDCQAQLSQRFLRIEIFSIDFYFWEIFWNYW